MSESKTNAVKAFNRVDRADMTLWYAAPEVVQVVRRGGKDERPLSVIKAGDIFSIAMISYETMTRILTWDLV